MSTTLPAKPKGDKSARWMPFALLESLQDGVERFLWPYGFGRPDLSDRLLRGVRMSQTDIYQQDGDLLVSVDLPGIKKEDISVALLEGDLLIQGESRAEEEQGKSYYWRERRNRSYYRRVRLPFEAHPDTITAKYADGVLEVRIPQPVEQTIEQQPIPVQ
jgi:HSP20 family protein